MFTVVKNKLADKPTSQDTHDQHASQQELYCVLPRFDKVMKAVEFDKRRKIMANSQTKVPSHNKGRRGYFKEPDFKIGSRHRDFTPDKLGYNRTIDGPADVDTRAIKMKFLGGDKEAVLYCDPNEPKTTSYSTTHKGLNVLSQQEATILDYNRTSYVGQIIPDPNMMSK